jgi:hypothetical protein
MVTEAMFQNERIMGEFLLDPEDQELYLARNEAESF